MTSSIMLVRISFFLAWFAYAGLALCPGLVHSNYSTALIPTRPDVTSFAGFLVFAVLPYLVFNLVLSLFSIQLLKPVQRGITKILMGITTAVSIATLISTSTIFGLVSDFWRTNIEFDSGNGSLMLTLHIWVFGLLSGFLIHMVIVTGYKARKDARCSD